MSVIGSAVLAGAVLVALALDVLFGEPPRVAPGGGHGALPGGGRPSRVARGRRGSAAGAEFWGWDAGLVCGCGAGGALWRRRWVAMQTLHPLARRSLLGALLKPMLSWRMLRDEVRAVEAALAESLEAGRQRVSWLVSRDVTR
jgi:adenosylcobinamide-phosphate synthase